MKAYNIGDLKNNPSIAIKDAKNGPVIVLNRNEPKAIIFSLEFIDLKDDLNKSLAVKLYQAGAVSLGKAAKIARMNYSDFISLLSNYKIPIIQYKIEDIEKDIKTGEQWLKKKQK